MSLKIKVYKPSVQPDDDLKLIDPKLPQPPFRLILIGPTMSGKSNLIKNYLFSKEFGYSKYFDEFYIFSGSLDDCEEYEKLAVKARISRKCCIVQLYDDEKVKELSTEIENDATEARKKDEKQRKVIFVFDDQICNNVCKPTTLNAIDELFIRGRHFNCSVIISAQTYMKLNQNTRDLNLSHLTIFAGTQPKDLTNIVKEHYNEQVNRILPTKQWKQYEFVTIDKKTGDVLDNNFDKTLNTTRNNNIEDK
jgi:hypothetical protein